jgi:hypothetical protein
LIQKKLEPHISANAAILSRVFVSPTRVLLTIKRQLRRAKT